MMFISSKKINNREDLGRIISDLDAITKNLNKLNYELLKKDNTSKEARYYIKQAISNIENSIDEMLE